MSCTHMPEVMCHRCVPDCQLCELKEEHITTLVMERGELERELRLARKAIRAALGTWCPYAPGGDGASLAAAEAEIVGLRLDKHMLQQCVDWQRWLLDEVEAEDAKKDPTRL